MQLGSSTHLVSFTRNSGSAELIDVQLTAGGLVARASITFFATDFAHFLKELAEHWKGWKGVKVFKTLESDFLIKAVHDGVGQVTLAVELISQSEDWRINADIPVDPGQLDSAQIEAKDVFAKVPKHA